MRRLYEIQSSAEQTTGSRRRSFFQHFLQKENYASAEQRRERFVLFSKYDRPLNRDTIDHKIFLHKQLLRVFEEKKKVEQELKQLKKRRQETPLQQKLAHILGQQSLNPELNHILYTLHLLEEELSIIRYEMEKLRLVKS